MGSPREMENGSSPGAPAAEALRKLQPGDVAASASPFPAVGGASARDVQAQSAMLPVDETTPITEQIIGAALAVHSELGPGLLETAYQSCTEYELTERGLRFDRQVSVPVVYRGVRVNCGYRVDLIVENCVIVEVKAVQALAPIFAAQIITYLKLTGCRAGLLLNFNVASMRQGIRRFTNRDGALR